MQIFITIIVMIVMLGILISTHELGHLAVAKAYNVSIRKKAPKPPLPSAQSLLAVMSPCMEKA